jgi:heme/copper-type cytochrome/quinol oxidase subunit 1
MKRLPLFAWMMLVASVLVVLALPVLPFGHPALSTSCPPAPSAAALSIAPRA